MPHRQLTPTLGLSSREVKSPGIVASHDVILMKSTSRCALGLGMMRMKMVVQ